MTIKLSTKQCITERPSSVFGVTGAHTLRVLHESRRWSHRVATKERFPFDSRTDSNDDILHQWERTYARPGEDQCRTVVALCARWQ